MRRWVAAMSVVLAYLLGDGVRRLRSGLRVGLCRRGGGDMRRTVALIAVVDIGDMGLDG